MSWFLKAVIYATGLAWLGHLAAPAYQSMLLGFASLLLGRPLGWPPGSPVDLSASNVQTVFIALCLASDFASWRRRLGALLTGVVLLVVIESATGALGIRLSESGAALLGSRWVTVSFGLLDLSRWLAVPLVWGALLGRFLMRGSRSGTTASRWTRSPGAERHGRVATR